MIKLKTGETIDGGDYCPKCGGKCHVADFMSFKFPDMHLRKADVKFKCFNCGTEIESLCMGTDISFKVFYKVVKKGENNSVAVS